jgi:hypothetical protein
MHAVATSYFEVGEMVRVRARSFGRERAALQTARPLLRLLVQYPVTLLINFAVGCANRVSNDLLDHAMWFRGMHDEVATLPRRAKLEATLEMIGRLDRMIEDVDALHANTSSLVARRKTRNAPRSDFTAALQNVVHAAEKLRFELKDFRACVLEVQDQCGIFRADPVFDRVQRAADSMTSQTGLLSSGKVDDLDPELVEEARQTLQALQR